MSEKVVVKEFGPEMTGETVGWMKVWETDRRGGLVVDLAVGNVAIEGASVFYETERGNEGTIYPNAQGFERVSSLRMIAESREDSSPSVGSHAVIGSALGKTTRDVSPNSLILRPFSSNVGVLDDGIDWALGESEFLCLLKEQTERAGLASAYAPAYLYLNHARAHYNFAPIYDPSYEDGNMNINLIVDRDMENVTATEIAVANKLADLIADMGGENEEMTRNLTVFGDVEAEDIETVFATSRETMHDFENEIKSLESQLLAPRALLLSSGAGRTWPYMDSAEADTDKAYGRELQGLEEREIEPAMSQLKSELSSIAKREKYLHRGKIVLGTLNYRETHQILLQP